MRGVVSDGGTRAGWAATWALVATAVSCLLTVSAAAQENGSVPDEAERRAAVEFSADTSFENVEAFVESFKAAVRERSCFKVAALTQFPLRIYWWRGEEMFYSNALSNRTALCRYFRQIFSDETSRIVEGQDVLDMPVGWRGLMFGSGSVWLEPGCAERTADGLCPGDTDLRFTHANISLRVEP